MARRTLTSKIYRAARITNTASALSSGKPARVARRGKNIAVGRTLFGRRGIAKGIWR